MAIWLLNRLDPSRTLPYTVLTGAHRRGTGQAVATRDILASGDYEHCTTLCG